MKSIGKQIYIYFALIIIGMCFAGASLVFAQTEEDSGGGNDSEMLGQTNTSPSERGETLRTERAEEIPARQERVAERRGALSLPLQDRMTNLAENITNKMYAAILRFEQISDRLENRMGKLKERGVDTSSAEGELGKVAHELTAAKNILANIDIAVEEGVTSDDPIASFTALRAELREAAGHIRAAHAALRSTLAALKTAVKEADLGSGSSDAVSASPRTDTPVEAE